MIEVIPFYWFCNFTLHTLVKFHNFWINIQRVTSDLPRSIESVLVRKFMLISLFNFTSFLHQFNILV
jgi:hypothetical protein